MLYLVVGAVATLLAGVYLLLCLFPWIKYDWQWIRGFWEAVYIITRARVKDTKLVDLFEQRALETPTKSLLLFKDETYRYTCDNVRLK